MEVSVGWRAAPYTMDFTGFVDGIWFLDRVDHRVDQYTLDN